MVASEIIGKLADFDQSRWTIDRVFLHHDELLKPHQMLRSEGGMNIGLSLPQGENLFCGAVVYKDEHRLVVVDLVEEDVLEIRPEGSVQWARVGFNIGNMHHGAYLHEDCILAPYDSVLERLLQNMGVSHTRVIRKLDGLRANVTFKGGASLGHSHNHSHSYEHDNGHSHGKD